AREREGEAEAKVTAMVSVALSEGKVQAINYFVAQKYIEALKDIATSSNEKVILLPMESSGILGALAGIAEIAKESFANKGGANKGGANKGDAKKGGAKKGGAKGGPWDSER
ncbi:MAG: band-7 C-terminal domain-containing protein, partial [Rhodospirillales bacterium]